MSYNVLKFNKLRCARTKAREIRDDYGFLPSVFAVKNPETKNTSFVIIKPRGMKKQ